MNVNEAIKRAFEVQFPELVVSVEETKTIITVIIENIPVKERFDYFRTITDFVYGYFPEYVEVDDGPVGDSNLFNTYMTFYIGK